MCCIEEKGSNSIGINPGESHLFDILYTGESLIDHRKVPNFLFKLYNQIEEIYIYMFYPKSPAKIEKRKIQHSHRKVKLSEGNHLPDT